MASAIDAAFHQAKYSIRQVLDNLREQIKIELEARDNEKAAEKAALLRKIDVLQKERNKYMKKCRAKSKHRHVKKCTNVERSTVAKQSNNLMEETSTAIAQTMENLQLSNNVRLRQRLNSQPTIFNGTITNNQRFNGGTKPLSDNHEQLVPVIQKRWRFSTDDSHQRVKSEWHVSKFF